MLSFWSCFFVITIIMIVSIILMAHGHRRHCRHRCHLISAILYHPLWLLLFLPTWPPTCVFVVTRFFFQFQQPEAWLGYCVLQPRLYCLVNISSRPSARMRQGRLGGNICYIFRTCMKMHFYCHSDMWKSRIIIAYCCLWNIQKTIWGSIPPRPPPKWWLQDSIQR